MNTSTFTDDAGNEYAYTTQERKPTITHLATCADGDFTIVTTVALDNGKIMQHRDTDPDPERWQELPPLP